MDLFSFLATIILITSVVTLVVAFAAYLAYKIRNKRSPSKKKRDAQNAYKEGPIFIQPVSLAAVRELRQAQAMDKSVHPHREKAANEELATRHTRPTAAPSNRGR